MGKIRDLAKILGKTQANNPDLSALLDSDDLPVTAAVSGILALSSLDSLPGDGLTAGDTAYVSANNRFYVSNGSGWYNVALVNVTPSLTISPDGAVALNTDGTPTTITLTGQDSDNANLTFSVESDGSFLGLGTIAQDSSVFTITPFSSDSATQSSSTLTFKVTDGIGIGSGTTALSLTFSVGNSNQTTVLIKADDAATDEQVDGSSNTYSITENDGGGSSSGSGHVASSAFTPYHPGGYSTFLDGTGDYLSVAYSADHTFGSGQFTVECFVFMTAYEGSGFNTFLYKSDGTNVDWQFDYKNGTTELRFIPYVSSSPNTSAAVATATLALNTWHHVAATRDGSNDLRLFHNGSLLKTTSYSSTIDADGDATLEVGARQNGGTRDRLLTGYVRDVRIVKGSAVYTSAFTTPTAALTAISNTKLLLCHAPYIGDGTSDRHAVTIGGNPEQVRFGPYDYLAYDKSTHGGSVYFDGDGDYFTVGSASDGALTGTFTIECWFMLKEAYDAKVHTLISNYDGSGDNWNLQLRNGGEVWLAAAIGTTLSYTLNPLTNVWYHVAVSNNAAGNTGKLFVNGREVDSHSSASIYDDADMAASSQPITIGRVGNNSTQDMYGYISDVRILSGTHLRTAAFDPPTSPLTAITNTKVLTCNNKNDVWDQASGHIVHKGTTGTGVGLPASNTVRKWTGTGVSSIRASILAHTMMKPLGAGDFTIEGWVYFDTNNDPHGVFHTGSGFLGGGATFNYANANGCALGLNSSTGLWRVYHAGSATNASQQASATTWHHFAYVRHSGTIKLYIDGTATDISVSNTTNFTEPDIVLGAFYSSTYAMAGYLQDFRVSLYARYTSNFTAPTATFDG